MSAWICPCASASCTIRNTSQAVAPGAKATTSKRNHGGQHQTHQNGQSAAFVSSALTVINQSRGSAMERRRPHLRSSGAWEGRSSKWPMPAVYNLVWGFVQKALRTWAYVVHAASSSALGPPPSEASGPPGLCVAYEGGDAPEPTLAPSYSAFRSWQPEASGPPGHPGKCEGGDVPEPVADTAPNRFPPYVHRLCNGKPCCLRA